LSGMARCEVHTDLRPKLPDPVLPFSSLGVELVEGGNGEALV
jgi:hypothetical protein